jgi:SagB-type dehydrogenase family enzyme
MMSQDPMQIRREFLKDTIRQEIDFSQTEQNRGIAPPPVQKPCSAQQEIISLPRKEAWTSVQSIDLSKAMACRQSCRDYQPLPLQLDELAFLLWATQGVRKQVSPAVVLRTVHSAGCRHALETYLCVLNVQGLASGIYRYLPLDHGLVLEQQRDFLAYDIAEAALGQQFAGHAPVTFLWAALCTRMEWRYGLAAHKVIALDAGHVCQNLYLACAAIDTGACAIAAYDQQKADALVQVDGDEEFVVYLATVGKI